MDTKLQRGCRVKNTNPVDPCLRTWSSFRFHRESRVEWFCRSLSSHIQRGPWARLSNLFLRWSWYLLRLLFVFCSFRTFWICGWIPKICCCFQHRYSMELIFWFFCRTSYQKSNNMEDLFGLLDSKLYSDTQPKRIWPMTECTLQHKYHWILGIQTELIYPCYILISFQTSPSSLMFYQRHLWNRESSIQPTNLRYRIK